MGSEKGPLCHLPLSGASLGEGTAQACALSNKDVTRPAVLLNPCPGEEGWRWMKEGTSRDYSIVPSDYAGGAIFLGHYLIWREEWAF